MNIFFVWMAEFQKSLLFIMANERNAQDLDSDHRRCPKWENYTEKTHRRHTKTATIKTDSLKNQIKL